MTEGGMGLVFVLILAIGSSLIWHWLVRTYFAASTAATATTVFAFHVVKFLELGYIDATIIVTIVTTSFIAAAVAFLVGLPFRARRRGRP